MTKELCNGTRFFFFGSPSKTTQDLWVVCLIDELLIYSLQVVVIWFIRRWFFFLVVEDQWHFDLVLSLKGNKKKNLVPLEKFFHLYAALSSIFLFLEKLISRFKLRICRFREATCHLKRLKAWLLPLGLIFKF